MKVVKFKNKASIKRRKLFSVIAGDLTAAQMIFVADSLGYVRRRLEDDLSGPAGASNETLMDLLGEVSAVRDLCLAALQHSEPATLGVLRIELRKLSGAAQD